MNSESNFEDRYGSAKEDASGKLAKAESAELRPVRKNNALSNREESGLFTATNFGQSVVFQQSKMWSRAIVWGIMGITAALVTWACFARLEEAVGAVGKLETQDEVKKIQAPIGGVVRKILVKDGDKVKAGDLLIQLESNVPESQLTYLASTKSSLEQANTFYRSQMNPSVASNVDVSRLNIKPDILSSTKNRSSLVAETKLYRSELSGGGSAATLTAEQQNRLRSNLNELNTRLSTGKLGVGQTEQQMSENRTKRDGLVKQIESNTLNLASINSGMTSSRARLQTELSQIDKQINQTKARIIATEKALTSNQQILTDIRPAAEQGALSRVQVSRQEQEVNTRVSELAQQQQEQSRLELEKTRLVSASQSDQQTQQQRLEDQNQQIKQRRSEMEQLDKEYVRLQLNANQGVEKMKNDVAVTQKDLYARISENEKQIAAIDSQLNKEIVENDKKIAEIANQITQATQNLKYQEIRSPVDGEVSELKVFTGGVVNANSTEPLVKVVPADSLIAKVFILNKDIGFVNSRFMEAQKNNEKLKVDVRIDSFSFSEFGDVKGTLESIGSDVIPPDQSNPNYRFPARIRLDRQALAITHANVTKDVELKNGMSINANIKLRDRTVMSIFTEMFTRQSDSLKNVR
jgi:hemolysin D